MRARFAAMDQSKASPHQHGEERCEAEHQDADKGNGLRVSVIVSCAEHQPASFFKQR